MGAYRQDGDRQGGMPPRGIALVDTTGARDTADSATAGLLDWDPLRMEPFLDDFEDALLAYARYGKGPAAGAPNILRSRLRPDGACEHPDGQTGAAGFEGVGAVVIAYPVAGGELPSPVPRMLTAHAFCRPDGQGPLLYAIAATARPDPGVAAASFERLAPLCPPAGFAWQGGLAIGDGALAASAMGCARMGILRRSVSEATDRLILRVRCGGPAGVIPTAPKAPRFLRRLLIGGL